MPPRGGADRHFNVGETVHFRSRVAEPGTRTPTDPATVALTSLRLDDVEVLPAPREFVRQQQGEFTLALPTADLAPGTYHVSVTHSDGPERVTIVTDRFVLQAAV